MDGVVDKDDVFIAINKVHDRFGGMAVGEDGGEKKNIIMGSNIFSIIKIIGQFTVE